MKLPRYKCHKEVSALKIGRIDGNTIWPEDGAYDPFNVSAEYLTKHNPQPGGYWVQYDDTYESFSPAKAFEDGYTRI